MIEFVSITAHGAVTYLHILLAQGREDFVRGQATALEFCRIEPDPHAKILGAEDLHLPNTIEASQNILDLRRRVVAQENITTLGRRP